MCAVECGLDPCASQHGHGGVLCRIPSGFIPQMESLSGSSGKRASGARPGAPMDMLMDHAFFAPLSRGAGLPRINSRFRTECDTTHRNGDSTTLRLG
jgi:hypothetical protein